MSNVNNFTGLKWIEAPNLKFDGDTKTKGAFKKGKFSVQGIREYMNKLSKDANAKSKKGVLSVSIHYKDINKWKAGRTFKVGDNANTFNPYDEFYDDDEIDGIQIYYISNEAHEGKHISGKQSSINKQKMFTTN